MICKAHNRIHSPRSVADYLKMLFIALRENGLRAVVADSLFNDSYPVNTVIRTSPPSGAKVDKSTWRKCILAVVPSRFGCSADSIDTTCAQFLLICMPHVVSITSPNPACILMRIEISAPRINSFSGPCWIRWEGVANHTASDRSNEMRFVSKARWSQVSSSFWKPGLDSSLQLYLRRAKQCQSKLITVHGRVAYPRCLNGFLNNR